MTTQVLSMVGTVVTVIAVGIEAHRFPQRYDFADTLKSVGHCIASSVASVALAPVVGLIFAVAHRYAVAKVAPAGVLQWSGLVVAAIVLDDLSWYWAHRAAHMVPLLWLSHRTHHSSVEFNYSVALRQPWAWSLLPTWMPWLVLAWLGEPLGVISAVRVVSVFAQTWVHTQSPGWSGDLLSSPSAHRVHHAVNPYYRDKNFGGLLMVWDRMFGTFVRESEPVVYGVSK